MPRNVAPSTIVAMSQAAQAFRFAVCAACTASTIVKLLSSSTTVLMPPHLMLSRWLPTTHASG